MEFPFKCLNLLSREWVLRIWTREKTLRISKRLSIRFALKYPSVIFSCIPNYFSDFLEGVQKRALTIIFPSFSYEQALNSVPLLGLFSFKRNAKCFQFYQEHSQTIQRQDLLWGRYPIFIVCIQEDSEHRPFLWIYKFCMHAM